MPITAKQETGAAYDFRVNQVEFNNPVNGEKTGLFANIRQDNNEILGVVSKRYSIVNNSDILGRADSALESAGMPYKRKVYSLEGGRKMKAYYDIGVDEEGKVINEAMTRHVSKGDIMGFRLIAVSKASPAMKSSKLKLWECFLIMEISFSIVVMPLVQTKRIKPSAKDTRRVRSKEF